MPYFASREFGRWGVRLRTVLCNSAGGITPSFFGMYALKHDAVLAHALVMALSEQESDACGSRVMFSDNPENFSTGIYERADEIMKSWGFGED